MHTAKFKRMVRDYKNLVYSQALYSTGNRHDAADVTQEVLLKLWNNMDKVEHLSAKSWLVTVTRNQCIDLKRKKREKYFSEFNTYEGENPASWIPASSETDPEKILDKAEEHKRIVEAIARLPEKIRTTIILRYIQELSYDGIARTIECPINSVKVYLHRGRKMLAQTLKGLMQK